MKRAAIVSLVCTTLLVACDSGTDQHDPIPEPTSSKGLVIEQRSLPADTTLTALGLRPEDSEKADARWSYQCDYSRPISLEDAWKQRFRVTVQNVATEALEFEVTIVQQSADGENREKRRDLGRLLIPPLTEKRFSGYMLSPYKPGDKLCEVKLFDPDES